MLCYNVQKHSKYIYILAAILCAVLCMAYGVGMDCPTNKVISLVLRLGSMMGQAYKGQIHCIVLCISRWNGTLMVWQQSYNNEDGWYRVKCKLSLSH